MERWLQLMLKWCPRERGKDPESTPSDCFSQLELILQLKVNLTVLLSTPSFSLMWICFCCFGLMLTHLIQRLWQNNFLRPKCHPSVFKFWCNLKGFCIFTYLLSHLSSQLVHVLNMMSAKILTYSVSDEETVADLQLRIEKDTSIPAANQELLLEAGIALEPHGLATQCAIDYKVMSYINTWHCTHNIFTEKSTTQYNDRLNLIIIIIIICFCRR